MHARTERWPYLAWERIRTAGEPPAAHPAAVALYQDEGHLSAPGSALIGERFGLNRIVTALDRADTDPDQKGKQ